MKNSLFFIFLFFSSLICISSGDNTSLGARSEGMGNNSVALTDVWCSNNNQAGLAYLQNISGGVHYENKFLLKQLSVNALAFALPFKGGTFGLLMNSMGYSLYKENKIALSYAKAFGDKLSMGISMDYISTVIGEGYGKKNMFAAEFGIQTKPIKNLVIGAHLFNPTHAKLADYNNERIPTILRLGSSYSFSEKVLLCIETEKDISHKAIFKTGMEYHLIKELYLRAGISSQPVLSSFGLGINLEKWQIDLSANYHQSLGFSPSFSLTYVHSKKEGGK